MSVVWVLGAGMSRSLGGPLLDDLFTLARSGRVAACFPKDRFRKLHEAPAGTVLAKYRAYGPQAPASDTDQRRWSDAEQFLEFLDRAGAALDHEHPARRMLVQLFGSEAPPRAQTYSWAARRLLAAECHEFLMDADPKGEERWAPYRRWVEQLGEHHTVISFNYDLVVERASEAVGRKVHVALPGHAIPEGAPVLLKLHGSVDWQRKPGRVSSLSPPDSVASTYQQVNVEYMLNDADDKEIVIASPGPGKFALASGDLRALWAEAVVRITHANAVVFVGYRFPPSDSSARRTLLDAISANRAERLILHTVLGPDVHDPHTRRLSGLLGSALRLHNERLYTEGSEQVRTLLAYGAALGHVVNHPLLAQDFFDTFRTADLTRAPS